MIETTAIISNCTDYQNFVKWKISGMTSRKKHVKILKNTYEYAAWEEKSLVCGIDEVGRGCLAGPLVSAAVILPIGTNYRRLKDSKLMTPEERLLAYKWIKRKCWYGIGIINNRMIDKHNIWGATILSMKKALVQAIFASPKPPSAILIDAVPLKLIDTGVKDIPVYHFPKGEKKSSSIAAASILAKVTRDQLMGIMDPLFPGYGLESHKGYAAKSHRTAIWSQKHSIIHRMSFLSKTLAESKESEFEQQTIDSFLPPAEISKEINEKR